MPSEFHNRSFTIRSEEFHNPLAKFHNPPFYSFTIRLQSFTISFYSFTIRFQSFTISLYSFTIRFSSFTIQVAQSAREVSQSDCQVSQSKLHNPLGKFHNPSAKFHNPTLTTYIHIISLYIWYIYIYMYVYVYIYIYIYVYIYIYIIAIYIYIYIIYIYVYIYIYICMCEAHSWKLSGNLSRTQAMIFIMVSCLTERSTASEVHNGIFLASWRPQQKGWEGLWKFQISIYFRNFRMINYTSMWYISGDLIKRICRWIQQIYIQQNMWICQSLVRSREGIDSIDTKNTPFTCRGKRPRTDPTRLMDSHYLSNTFRMSHRSVINNIKTKQ